MTFGTIRHAILADADACAAVHVAAWEASYRAIMPAEEFEKRSLGQRRRQWREWLDEPAHTTLVACDRNQQIAGFSGGWRMDSAINGFDSYLAILYLRPDMKGRGLGKRLLVAFASEMLARGAKSMALRTLRFNPARRFYEHLGARLVQEGMALEAGTFDDVVYAFDDLAALVDAGLFR